MNDNDNDQVLVFLNPSWCINHGVGHHLLNNQPTNIHVNFYLPDPDDPEYRRNLQRPAEVKEDMKQMEGRSRVKVVLNSQAFKEELEEIIQDQFRQGGPASIFALQQISDLLLPQARGSNSSFGRCKYVFLSSVSTGTYD